MCDGRVIGTTLHGVDIFCSGTGGSPDPHGRWPLRGGCKHPATQRPLYSPQQPNTSTLLRFGAHAFESFGGQAGAILVNNHNITLNHPRLLTTYPFKQPQHFNTSTHSPPLLRSPPSPLPIAHDHPNTSHLSSTHSRLAKFIRSTPSTLQHPNTSTHSPPLPEKPP